MMKIRRKWAHIALMMGMLSLFSACSAKRYQPVSSVDSANEARMQEMPPAADEQEAITQGAGSSTAALNEEWDSPEKKVTQPISSLVYHFDFDSSQVRPENKSAIKVQAHYLLVHPHAKMILEGHTDPRGSREYNIGLGERRAKAVEQLLISYGASSHQIRPISYGATKLAVPNERGEAAYQKDRRVVLIYKKR